MHKTAAIHNLGCKVNSYEADAMRQMLMEEGYEIVDFSVQADVYVINTCSVTNVADKKSRQMIRRARKTNPSAIVVACGCYVQTADRKALSDLDIDLVIGNNQKAELIPQLNRISAMRQNAPGPTDGREEETPGQDALTGSVIDINQGVPAYEDLTISRQTGHTRAFIKVQDGCNQFCTYCVIPLARGRERSLDADRVIDIARTLTEKGHSELVLTGIHTGRYYHDGTDFTALVRRLLTEVPELRRLRISSIEMTEVTDEFIELMKNDERIARHLHIPLQSGCDRTLKAMGRPYTTEDYLNKIESIRHEIPDISISSDVIVGFPGESEEDFAATVEFIERARLSFLHVFPYAAKQHTVAAGMKQQVREEIKRQRVTKLTELSDRLYNDYVSGLTGKQGKVLFERKMDGYWQGHNSEYVLVKVASDEDLAGRILTVSYHRRDGECLIGSLREDQKHEHK